MNFFLNKLFEFVSRKNSLAIYKNRSYIHEMLLHNRIFL